MYCNICHSENCEHQDRSCPCGCGFDKDHPNRNCVYDTPAGRHLKNLMNGLPDEAWVIEGLRQRR
jgi:hypothetical protein